MVVEAKDIKLYIWRFFLIFVKTASLYVLRYPLASGILFIFFLLYLLFPFLFKLLVCSIPVLACIAAGASKYLSSGSANCTVENLKGDGKSWERDLRPSKACSVQDGMSIPGSKKPLISAQMSKRRNFKTKRDDQNAHGPKDVVNRAAELSIPDDSIVGKNGKTEESEDPILGERKTREVSPEESSSKAEDLDELAPPVLDDSQTQKDDVRIEDEISKDLDTGGPSGSQIERELEEAEEDDEEDQEDQEDQAQDYDGNRAVEWTEDDQKNVMDLGFSEHERNRRLENLITKRRARKLMVALRPTPNLLDQDNGSIEATSSQMPPVLQTIKNNPFDTILPSEEMADSLIPGSAPSVLLPCRNPFDIPYDPLEEKPNLSTDGFHQDILASSQPRDIFCRHESFTLGSSVSPEIYQDHHGHGEGLNLYMLPDGQVSRESRLSRSKRLADKGDHDRLVEQILYQEHSSSDHDHVERENKSLEEVPALDIRQEGDTKAGATEEKHVEYECAYSTGTQSYICPENDVLAMPKERDAESDSSLISKEHKDKFPEATGDGQDTSEVGKSDNFPQEEPKNPEELQDSHSGSHTAANGPFYGSSQSIIEYLDRGMRHSTTYSIASDMQVEVSETGSPRNISDDIMSSPDVIEEDELRLKELNNADHQLGDDAEEDLGISESDKHFANGPSLSAAASLRDMDEEDSASKMSTSSSSTTRNPEEVRASEEDQAGSSENIYNMEEDKEERGESKPGSPDSLESEIPEEVIQFVDNSIPQEDNANNPEEISSSPSPPGSSSVELRDNPNEIVESNNRDEIVNSGPDQGTVGEMENQTGQDIVPHDVVLEEEDINPFASPVEEAKLTYTAIELAAQTAEDGEIKAESAEGLEGESETRDV